MHAFSLCRFSRLLLCSGLALACQRAALADDESAAKEAVVAGDLTQYRFDQSKIFPGTTRDYWVYVPKQYDPAKPACVHVEQDGVQFNAPAVFDLLIAKKEMPVTIGVFVTPGQVLASNEKEANRNNRSFEYDGLGDDYARFLLEELLPEVEKKTAPDGREIRLSHEGNDRALGGASSGAVCAFTAAWERPAAFTRVFSAIGTYVDMRGGNDYPTLIRKTEPKPIRIFLQDGKNDMHIFGGDWWIANQEMERALGYAGYEVMHAWGDGGHDGNQAQQVFPDAIRWLWKDWPAPVKAGAGGPDFRDLLVADEPWKLVSDGYTQLDVPAANADGEVYFNEVVKNKAYKIGLDGQVSVTLADSQYARAQAFGPDGRLYFATGDNIAIRGPVVAAMFAENVEAENLVVSHSGAVYATSLDAPGEERSQVWYVSPAGEKKVVDTGLKSASGVTLSPDQSFLLVADRASHWIYSYRIKPDGTLTHKQRYCHLRVPDTADDSGAGGMCVDRDGKVYVATRLGIQVCDQLGRVICILPLPTGTANGVCFGGKDFDTLMVTCGDRVYRRQVKVKGAQAFAVPNKPSPPRIGQTTGRVRR